VPRKSLRRCSVEARWLPSSKVDPRRNLELITCHPTWVTSSEGFDHRLGEFGRVAHQGGTDAGFNAIEFIVEGGGGDPDSVSISLIGSMDAGMNPEHHFAHQLHERGEQKVTRILLLGSAGKELIKALGIEESLQDGSSHHTDRTLLNEGSKNGVQQHGRHLQGAFRQLSNEATI